MVERHRHVRAEGPLDLGRALRGEDAAAAVHVTLKLDAVIGYAAEALEREHLEAAGVRQQRPVPGHEPVQAAELRDDVLAGPHVQVVGVGEHHPGPDGLQIAGRQRPHGALRADGHEDGRLDRAVR